jgi:hypothetical protein
MNTRETQLKALILLTIMDELRAMSVGQKQTLQTLRLPLKKPMN